MKGSGLLLASVLFVLTVAFPPALGATEDFRFVTTAEVKKMLDGGEDFILANTLSPIEYAEKHIPGSVSMPMELVDSGEAELPASKGKKIVLYCLGPKCTKSKHTASALISKGYTNVFVYDEGLPGWMQNGHPVTSDAKYGDADIPLIDPADLKKMLDGGETVVIVDIRSKSDREAGVIENSLSIPIVYLDKRFAEIPTDKKVVIADLHGKQTLTAAKFLSSKGYKSLLRLDGGIFSGWLKAGLPVRK